MHEPTHDVAILGSGIAGSMLGAILARHGARVLLVDAATHPRFAIGESTIPYTLVTLRTIAERYDVPEITNLTTFTGCTRHIGPSFGIKKGFGFLLHRDGEEPDPHEVNQFNTPGLLHEASQLFRQDTDQYMYHVAIGYGCEGREQLRIDAVDPDDTGVTLVAADGERFRARYVVDGSGYRSPLAERFGLRDDPCRFSHHSRSIFTHMVDVATTEAALRHGPGDRPPAPWSSGTVHHLFERGWFWIIPFNNHPASRNPLVSVGLTFDPRTYPLDDTMSAEEEFWTHVRRFPAVERQLRGARSVREWTRTGRLQYSSSSTVGPRFALLSHAAGFIDPLFSRGLSNSAEVINALAYRLLGALAEDDFDPARFAYVDRLQQGLLDHNDALVDSSFIAFGDYPLWNAVFRIWAFGSNFGTFRLQNAITRYWSTRDDDEFVALEDAPHLGLMWPDHDGFAALFDQMVRECRAVERGDTKAIDASDRLFDALRTADYVPPHMHFADPGARYLQPDLKKMAGMFRWTLLDAPPDIRRLVLSTSTQAAKARLRGTKIF